MANEEGILLLVSDTSWLWQRRNVYTPVFLSVLSNITWPRFISVCCVAKNTKEKSIISVLNRTRSSVYSIISHDQFPQTSAVKNTKEKEYQFCSKSNTPLSVLNHFFWTGWTTSYGTKVRTIATLVPAEQGRYRLKLRHLNFTSYPSRTRTGPRVTLVATPATMNMSFFWNDENDLALKNESMFGQVSTINGAATLLYSSSRWSRSMNNHILTTRWALKKDFDWIGYQVCWTYRVLLSIRLYLTNVFWSN